MLRDERTALRTPKGVSLTASAPYLKTRNNGVDKQHISVGIGCRSKSD